VLEIRPPHLSVYDLTIEAGTKFGRLYHPGFSPLPSEEDTVQMYLLAIQALTAAGYEHYEISNFALPGSQCRHNRVYWENRSYYGFGMGAVAYVQKRRIHQPKTLHDYFQQVQKQISPSADLTTQQEEWQDTVMLGLRLREGLQLDCLRAQFSDQRVEAALDRLEPFRQQGWISWSEGRLRLMPPQGWLFSNTVLATLFDLD
jgi:oxygen-independent coproporphyrinogen-3 oxidase